VKKGSSRSKGIGMVARDWDEGWGRRGASRPGKPSWSRVREASAASFAAR
jgi:hypothetical protein